MISILDLGNMDKGKKYTLEALNINAKHFKSAWNLHSFCHTIIEAEQSINLCLSINNNDLKSKIMLAALKYHQGENALLDNLLRSEHKNHPFARSVKWVSSLPYVPILFF